MRVLYLEHQAFGLRLRPAQVADRLRERYALTVDLDWLEQRLAALDQWGALERDHDASLASTAAEWRRNRYTYDVTPAGRLTEELLARLDALGEEIGRLDTARLPAIRDVLAKLADELAQPEPDGTRLRGLFERLLAEVEALHGGALAFMRSLGDLMRAVEQVGEDEFERGKGALLEHLQGFKKSRMQHSAEILALLEQIELHGSDRLVERIVAAEEFVALPGGSSVDDQRARRQAELLQRWEGLRAWFVGDEDSGSPWRTLNDQVVDAIRAVLAIAERLIERRSLRVDRAGVLLHLAAQVAAAPPGQAPAWLRAAFGLRTPRHVGVPEPDPEQIAERGRTSWLRSAARAGGGAPANARACGRPGLDVGLRSRTCPRAAGGSRSAAPRSAGSSTSCSRGWALAGRSRSRRSSVSTRTSSVTCSAGSAAPTSPLRAATARGARAPPTAARRSPCDRRPTRVASERGCAPRTARSTCPTSRSRCCAGERCGN